MLLPVLCFSMLMLTACLCGFVYLFSLVGTWNVYDLVGTKSIGSTEVTFKPQGELSVKPPMQVSSIILCTFVLLEFYHVISHHYAQGLRWRLDPGPTHLDTCTFQVLSDDGAILQYKVSAHSGAIILL